MFSAFKNLFTKNKTVTPPKPRRFRPSLESLDQRIVPATMNWLGYSSDFSTASNWIVYGSSGSWVPGSNDVARFSADGSNNVACTYTGGALTIGGIRFEDGYTQTLTVNCSTGGLTVNGELLVHGKSSANVKTDAKLTLGGDAPILGINGAFNIKGANLTINGPQSTGEVWAAGGGTWETQYDRLPNLDVNIGKLVLYNQVVEMSSGEVRLASQNTQVKQWVDTTTTLYSGNFKNSPGVTSNQPYFLNDGELVKVGSTTFTFDDVPIKNSGSTAVVSVQEGTLSVTCDSSSYYAYLQDHASAITNINDGATLYANGYGEQDAWVKYGNLLTHFVTGETTAYFKAGTLTIGAVSGSTATVKIHNNSTSNYGTLYNNVGSIVFQETGRLEVTVKADGTSKDKLQASGEIYLDGTLVVSVSGTPQDNTSWTVVESDNNNINWDFDVRTLPPNFTRTIVNKEYKIYGAAPQGEN